MQDGWSHCLQATDARVVVCCAAAEMYHTTSHIWTVTQQVVNIFREQLGLPTKVLPTRRAEVPQQLWGSNACGYYAALNYGCVVYDVLKNKSTSSFVYSECTWVTLLLPLLHRAGFVLTWVPCSTCRP